MEVALSKRELIPVRWKKILLLQEKKECLEEKEGRLWCKSRKAFIMRFVKSLMEDGEDEEAEKKMKFRMSSWLRLI